ncbi:helix-turn-helix domain-containing protein [Zhouia amylolytica]|uniref:HTH cro/C1-type domain-containing protein n=1 Tax=Zhouia amylolytica AD3 TaxID=1286632 RepID=W2ULU2_9FLAO|nr:helix-turn-helix domain-containing protein [Zhouia amylolytica]ETN94411.1 hypothetical protein P278_23540 [Zhouia amylolytica AD3]
MKKNENLSEKVKFYRARKGFSQEQLSEESKLSLRTIQRIEKGESSPKGDTLLKLTIALGITPDDLLCLEKVKDTGYLSLMHLGALGFLYNPALGVLVPLILWLLKRDKIRLVDSTGKNLVNFQLTWLLATTIYLVVIGAGITPVNLMRLVPNTISKIHPLVVPVFLLYGYNLTMIIINLRRSQKMKKSRYMPVIRFIK